MVLGLKKTDHLVLFGPSETFGDSPEFDKLMETFRRCSTRVKEEACQA
jgi:hypothetical protein